MTAAQDPGPVPVHGALKFHSSAAAAVAARGHYGANLKSNPNAGANRGWRSRGSRRGGVVALLVRKGGVFGAIVLASIWCQK